MQELISLITQKVGISHEQATKVLETIKGFVQEKFPMMAGAVDNLFEPGTETNSTLGATTAVIDPEAPEPESPSILDKISDVIPGQTGEKVENFVKGAAHKAEDVYEDVKEKLSGLFGGDKDKK